MAARGGGKKLYRTGKLQRRGSARAGNPGFLMKQELNTVLTQLQTYITCRPPRIPTKY